MRIFLSSNVWFTTVFQLVSFFHFYLHFSKCLFGLFSGSICYWKQRWFSATCIFHNSCWITQLFTGFSLHAILYSPLTFSLFWKYVFNNIFYDYVFTNFTHWLIFWGCRGVTPLKHQISPPKYIVHPSKKHITPSSQFLAKQKRSTVELSLSRRNFNFLHNLWWLHY